MSEANCTIVMYHYVRDVEGTPYRLHARSVREFERQLDYLTAHYRMIGIGEYLDYLDGDRSLEGEGCLLSFDDGLKDHYRSVYPLLKQRRISGIFLLITEPLVNFRVAPVHKIHFLMARLGTEAFRERFLKELRRRYPRFTWEGEGASLEETGYRYDDVETARFKRLLNFDLEPGRRDEILSSLFEAFIGDEGTFSRDLYLSWEEIKEMQKGGMVFGGHSHTHPVLSRLPFQEADADLHRCHEILTAHLPLDHFPFAYPYGRQDTFNETIAAAVAGAGFSCALTTVRGQNVGRECSRYHLKRLDTNDVKGWS